MTTITLPRPVAEEVLKILSALVNAQDEDCGDLRCSDCEYWRGVRELVKRLEDAPEVGK